jgi:hypothetical protein
MKKIYFIVSTFCLTTILIAQTPEDALKLSWSNSSGTARNMAIGGTMIGLGGEITSAHTNPAGLGFFKNSEFVFSPGFNFGNTNKSDYRGTLGTKGNSTSNFNLGTTGVIFAGGTNNAGKIKSGAVSISVNRLADYNNSISYKGLNNASSGAERFAEEWVKSRYNDVDALNSRFVSVGTRLAIYTYLVDTLTLNGRKEIVAFPEFAGNLNQTNTINTSGSSNEFALSMAVNKEDKLFIGGSIGMPIVNYNKKTTFREEDVSTTNTTNGFSFFNYEETLKTTGIGFNGKIGIIYRPIEKVRIGATINSPTFYSLMDKSTATMGVKTENLAQFPGRIFANTATVTQKVLLPTGTDAVENKYSYSTPWKVGIGASYVFNEVKDVRKQKAFIAADVEYVTYKTMRFGSLVDDLIADSYYKGTNTDIKTIYRNTLNVKLGGEVKFNTIMVRLGGAMYGNPNKDSRILKQNRVTLSGGLGYRHKGIFIDATYIHQMNKAADMPYRLADKPNTFANVKGKAGTVMVTIGTKF